MYPSFSTLGFFLLYSSSSFSYNYSVPYSPVFSVFQYILCSVLHSRFWLYALFPRYILSFPSSVFHIAFWSNYSILHSPDRLLSSQYSVLILDSGSSFFCILSLLFCILHCLSSPTILFYTLLSSLFSICYVLHWILASEFWFCISLSSLFCSVVHIHGHSQVSSVSKFTVSSLSVLVASLLLSQVSQYYDFTVTILTWQPHKISFHLYTSASYTKGSLILSIHLSFFS